MTPKTIDRQRALEAHLAAWFPHEWEEFSSRHGSIASRFPAFRVGRGRALPDSSWCYLTLGAWHATRDNHHALEYFILSPRPTAYHVETLTELTRQWADARAAFIGHEGIDAFEDLAERSSAEFAEPQRRSLVPHMAALHRGASSSATPRPAVSP